MELRKEKKNNNVNLLQVWHCARRFPGILIWGFLPSPKIGTINSSLPHLAGEDTKN